MAYRPLVEGDKVKVVKKGSRMFGEFVVVTKVSVLGRVEVECRGGDYDWFDQSDLMVAFDYTGNKYLYYKHVQQMESNLYDEPECPYNGWDRDDLIERIKDLESFVEDNC